MKRKNLFFIDAETDGLYGAFLTIAIIVTDADCKELERTYLGIKRDCMEVREPWVLSHVLPYMDDYEECQNETDLLERVWQLWVKYHNSAYAIADVAYPVEMRIFQECVKKDPYRRVPLAPFPLLDLSSLLYAKGVDPNISRQTFIEKYPDILLKGKQHNALYDVEMEIAIYKKLLLTD